MKPTLLVLAAGMGSRYGGLKQLDGVGPNGETIMDYSVFDAVRGGFGKIVFVIRESFERDFRGKILDRYKYIIPTEIVFQSIDKLPQEFLSHPDRIKPWGTNHAIMMSQGIIHEPFAVINADDFYGYDSFEILANYLKSVNGKRDSYVMVGYKVGNTLSESGSVARGICEIDNNGFLTSIVERTHIMRGKDGKIKYKADKDNRIITDESTSVSMNMWGFTPEYFDYSYNLFVDFLIKNQNDINAEFFIPSVINQLIVNHKITVKVLDTPSQWFGVTYPDDRISVVAKIDDLIKKGKYPNKLF